MNYKTAYSAAQRFSRKFLKSHPPILVGSLRRKEAIVNDIDFLIIGDSSSEVLSKIRSDPNVSILSAGTKTILLKYKNIRVDLFFTTKEDLIPAVLHYTGSKTFNIRIRRHAKAMGYKLNQYGLFDSKGKKIKVTTEKQIFKILGIDYKKPEDRDH